MTSAQIFNEQLQIGSHVERGDRIGSVFAYPGNFGYGLYEIRFVERREPSRAVALNVYDYAGLSSSDKARLQSAWFNSPATDDGPDAVPECRATNLWGDLTEYDPGDNRYAFKAGF